MKSQYVLPLTIVIAGALIAGGIFLAGKGSITQPPAEGEINAREYTPGVDHILGNPSATVKVVEYMDLECPHCKLFNQTMHQVMDYYGASGKVAWVVRPFPLASIHSKAPKEAEAAECAAEQGGDEAFFKYVDRVFEVTPSDNGLELAQLPTIATEVGLNAQALSDCLASGKYTKKVTDSYAEAMAAGGQGTPYTLIMVGKDSVALSGAQPYDSMRAAIDAILSQTGGTVTPPTASSTTP